MNLSTHRKKNEKRIREPEASSTYLIEEIDIDDFPEEKNNSLNSIQKKNPCSKKKKIETTTNCGNGTPFQTSLINTLNTISERTIKKPEKKDDEKFIELVALLLDQCSEKTREAAKKDVLKILMEHKLKNLNNA